MALVVVVLMPLEPVAGSPPPGMVGGTVGPAAATRIVVQIVRGRATPDGTVAPVPVRSAQTW